MAKQILVAIAMALAVGCGGGHARAELPPRDDRPLELAIAIDTSGSMRGRSLECVQEGLTRLAASLRPGDRVTLVAFADEAKVLVESVPADSPALAHAIASMGAMGRSNVYAGLREAFEAVHRHADPQRRPRVILLSDGQPTTGLVHDPRLLAIAEAYGAAGVGLSTIGMGAELDPTLLRGLAERGGGAFHASADPSAVVEIFAEAASA